jgi:ABC-type transporter Mla MlaB component
LALAPYRRIQKVLLPVWIKRVQFSVDQQAARIQLTKGIQLDSMFAALQATFEDRSRI